MTGMPLGTRGWRTRHGAERRGPGTDPLSGEVAAPGDAEREAVEALTADTAPSTITPRVTSLDDSDPATTPVHLDAVRLALVTDTYLPQLNGVTRTLARLVSTARARGAAVEVFTTTDPAAEVEDGIRREASLPFWGYPQLRLAVPDVRRVGRAMRGWGATLVHAATPFGMGLAARHAARRSAIPLVTSYHTHFTAYAHFYQLGLLSRPGGRFLRWFHNGGRRTYCPTASVARDLTDRGFARTAVWGRGVDSRVFSPAHRQLESRRSLGIADAELLVLYVGRVAREKGLDDLLAAMRLLRSLPDSPPCRLLIVGDGPYLEQCRRHAGVDVVFAGRRTGSELSQLYASADLFVFPSTTDTFGNVTLEAMASGLPVVAADGDVNRELIAPGAGSWYPAGDPAALAGHIARWGRDPALRRSAGVRGRSASRDRSWDHVFDDLFRDYHRVQSEASQPA